MRPPAHMVAVAEAVRGSIVMVRAGGRCGGGVVVRAGVVATCAHVIAQAQTVNVSAGSWRAPGRVVMRDDTRDLALIELDGVDGFPVPLVLDAARVGSSVVAIGARGGVARTVCHGEVMFSSARARWGGVDAGGRVGSFEIDDALLLAMVSGQGMSGGGIFDANGRLVGIVAGGSGPDGRGGTTLGPRTAHVKALLDRLPVRPARRSLLEGSKNVFASALMME